MNNRVRVRHPHSETDKIVGYFWNTKVIGFHRKNEATQGRIKERWKGRPVKRRLWMSGLGKKWLHVSAGVRIRVCICVRMCVKWYVSHPGKDGGDREERINILGATPWVTGSPSPVAYLPPPVAFDFWVAFKFNLRLTPQSKRRHTFARGTNSIRLFKEYRDKYRLLFRWWR